MLLKILEKFAWQAAWQAALKKTETKLKLTDIDMLLIIEKGISRGIYHAIH